MRLITNFLFPVDSSAPCTAMVPHVKRAASLLDTECH
jgi:hypothetical protein